MKQASSLSELRRFGLTVAGGLALIGLQSWYRGHTNVPTALWTIAVALFLMAIILPNRLHLVQKVWMGLAAVLGWINTRIILTALFYAVLTPIGVIMRMFRDPLDRRMGDGRASYWVRKKPKPFDPKTYEDSF